MASGIDLSKYSEHIVNALVSAQLDSDLADYYKLIATSFCQAGDFTKAQKYIDKFIELMIPEMGDTIKAKEDAMAKELEDMDSWLLKIDTASLPEPKGLILRNGKKSRKRSNYGGLKE